MQNQRFVASGSRNTRQAKNLYDFLFHKSRSLWPCLVGNNRERYRAYIDDVNKRAMMALNRSPEFKSSNPKPSAAELSGT